MFEQKKNEFESEGISSNLGYYIYALLSPDDDVPFYIGKGKGSRVFSHLDRALENPNEITEKYAEIQRIHDSGKRVKHLILRHGLANEQQAYEIEAALIDFCKYLKFPITNIAGGHKSIEKGLMTTDDIIRLYQPEKLNSIPDDCIIININRTYKRGSGENAIFNATKGIWAINIKRLQDNSGIKRKYVLSEYRGLIVEVFEVTKWFQAERVYPPKTKKAGQCRQGVSFEGKVASEEIRDSYINKTVARHKKPGASMPHRFSLKSNNEND